MKKLATKIRKHWNKTDLMLRDKYKNSKEARRVLNALASIVADYKHRKNS